MDQDKPEPTLEESIRQVIRTLPPVIRAYFAQGKYTIIAQNLMAKYGLRIDQGGVLEREIMLLLMGIDNPDEFIQVLAEEAKLDQKTITNIVQDVNTQIFVPLREEEEKKGGMMATPPASEQPKTYFHLENKIVPPSRPAVQPPRSGVSGSVGGTKLLEDHEESHIEFHAAPMPNIPSISISPIASKNETPSVPIPPKSGAPTAPVTPPASARPYAGDPYREPIEP
ncbi:MAG TPA: hypothetical protein VNF51_00845 [Candidatus Paceibacterota bacterium]|nr:hypothetical protein [Candidatus Paceibacterota bacterium]